MTNQTSLETRIHTWNKIFRVALSFVVFLIIWGLLFFVGNMFIDTNEVQKGLGESDWLKYLSPNIRTSLLSRGWQPLTALVVAIISYRYLGRVSKIVAERFFPPEPEVELSLDAVTVMDCLWKDKFLRREKQIVAELKISSGRVHKALRELQDLGLVLERKKANGVFLDKTAKGKRYMVKRLETTKHD